MCNIVFIYSSVDRLLGFPQFLVVVDIATIDVVLQVSLWYDESPFEFTSFEVDQLPEEPSYWFSYWLNKFSLPPEMEERSLVHILASIELSCVLLILDILTDIKENRKLVFIVITLMTKYVEDFKCFSTILVSLIEISVFKSVSYFCKFDYLFAM